MNDMILTTALVAIGVGSVCFMALVPAFAIATVRGQLLRARRLLITLAVLATATLAVSAVAGATSQTYSALM